MTTRVYLAILGVLVAGAAWADVAPIPAPPRCPQGAIEGAACQLHDGTTGACATARCTGSAAVRPRPAAARRIDRPMIARSRRFDLEAEFDCMQCEPGTPSAASDGGFDRRWLYGGGGALAAIAVGAFLLLRRKGPPAPPTVPAPPSPTA